MTMTDKELELEAEKYYKENVEGEPLTYETPIHCFIAGATSKYVEKQKEKLIKERDMYKQAYEELSCYFDSISDEEQPKIAKRLEKIFKNLDL